VTVRRGSAGRRPSREQRNAGGARRTIGRGHVASRVGGGHVARVDRERNLGREWLRGRLTPTDFGPWWETGGKFSGELSPAE
jgi:hypothetical protein